MKKAMALMMAFCLLLPCAALADVQSQVNAPEHITDMCQSNTGRTEINVDAVITVPDAESMYIIPVETTAFEDSMVRVLADLVWPGLGDRKMEIDDENDTWSVEGSRETRSFFRHSAGLVKMGTKKNDVEVQVHNNYYKYPSFEKPLGAALTANVRYDDRYRQKKTINYNTGYPDMEITDSIEGHPLTFTQAVSIGEQLMHTLTDQPFELFAVGQSRGIIYDDKMLLEDTAREGTGYSYTLAYTRVIDGAALLPAYGSMMNTSIFRDDLFIPAVGYEQAGIAINREGKITSFFWFSPYTISDERTEQTLLPFDKLLPIALQTLPLKYQAKETEQDIHLQVDRIALGYMAILQRDNLAFALTPVWNFYGRDTRDNNAGYRPLLTVNAVDGTVIDLEYGY